MWHSMSQGWLKQYLDHDSLVHNSLPAMVTVLLQKKDVQDDCSILTYLEAVVLGEYLGTINVINNKIIFLLHNPNKINIIKTN